MMVSQITASFMASAASMSPAFEEDFADAGAGHDAVT